MLRNVGPAPAIGAGMRQDRLLVAMLAAALLAACGPSTAPGPSSPPLTPPELTPEAEEGVKGARNILLSFARAIELGAHDQAWALLSAADKRRWSERAFAAIFDGLSDLTVAIPGGDIDDEAGSASYTAPLTVTARDADGRPVRIEGTAILRRADAAGGVSRRWRFETLTLDWTH